MEERHFGWIGAASGWGAQVRSCEEGPERLKELCSLQPWGNRDPSLFTAETLYPSLRASEGASLSLRRFSLVTAINHRLADEVFAALQKGRFPVVVGGDHSLAVGTWNGVGQFCSAKDASDFGLIWIDAHMDAHTPETTPSGAWHGMPLAALLGFGERGLAQLMRSSPILKPENLCLIGYSALSKRRRSGFWRSFK